MNEATNGGYILIVEDEDIVRKILELQVTGFGYKVYSAELPGKGISLFEEYYRNIELVILDMNMPEMDGLSVFRKMKETVSDVKVLILSGYSQHGKIEAAMEEGLAGFLTKPVRKDVLHEKILEIINGSGNMSDKGETDSMPVVDREFLEAQFSSIPGLQKKVIEAFFVSAPDLVKALEKAVDEGLCVEIAKKAHKCHGPIVSLGGVRAGAVVKSIENKAEECDLDNIKKDLEIFRADFTALIRELESLNE